MSEHELWNELGNLYLQSGFFDQAVNAFNKAIQIDSEYGKPYSNLALAYAHQANYEDAVRLYKMSLEHLTSDKEKAITWNRLGDVFRHLKDYQEALKAYQCADELQSNSNGEPEHQNQITFDSQEAVPLPNSDIENQPNLQNHSDEKVLDAGPEFEDELQELVPIDSDVLANEGYYDQDYREDLSVDDSTEQIPPLPFENMDIPVPDTLNTDSAPLTEDNDAKAKANGELEQFENFEEQPVKDTIQRYGGDSLPIETQNKDEVETVSAEMAISALRTGLDSTASDSEVNSIEENSNVDVVVESSPVEKSPWVLEEDLLLKGKIPENFTDNSQPFAQAMTEELETENEKGNSALNFPSGLSQESEENGDAASENVQMAERESDREEEKLTKQIELNPRSASTWEALGTLYKSTGRYDEAQQAFEQAISIAPSNVSYYHNLGLIYSAIGESKDAFNTFQKVLELDSNHSLTHASLGGYYKKIGLDDLAQKHIGKAMKHIYESENEYNRACLDAICGNKDQAIDLLRVALENEQTYVNWVLHDPDLDGLRDDDRFKQLISEFSK